MLELLTSPEAYVSLLVLTLMETILGIDNVVFITILCSRLPKKDQLRGRRLGLIAALASRLVLLGALTWIMRLQEPLFVFIIEWSGKDLILLAGGMFLLYKATREIYENVELPESHGPHPVDGHGPKRPGFSAILIQVVILDVVFSIDSVITAVGMADHIAIMVVAMLIAVGVMVVFAEAIGDFIQNHPSVRILALAFLLLIGVMLVIEATGEAVPKGYVYSAMGFSLLVELLNLRRQKKTTPA